MFFIITTLLIILFHACEVKSKVYTVKDHTKVVVCYWGTWANYRPDKGKFTPEDVDPSLCTHLIYSFVGLDEKTGTVKSLDTWMDLEDNYALSGFKKAVDLKLEYPHLKVSVAIGGWNEGSKKYSDVARNPMKRRKFARSAAQFVLKHQFDGLDLDWEYPSKRGGATEDKENFILLLSDLYTIFKKNNLLLTAAIGATAQTMDVSYNIPKMYRYLDFVHVMCYDYHGKWDKYTGHNAPLHARNQDSPLDQTFSLAYTIAYIKKLGAIPGKTVLGVPFYGRSYKLLTTNNEIGALTKEESFAGPYTREEGFLGYNEVCEEQMDEEHPWTYVWEDQIMGPYIYRGDRWVSFDDEMSLEAKANFAFDEGLAGVMVWSIDTDDFRGVCGEKYPLLRSLNRALFRRDTGLSLKTEKDSDSGSVIYCIHVWLLLLTGFLVIL